MTANTFYPSIKTLIDPEDIPEALSFVREGVDALLDGIFIKDLQIMSSGADAKAYNVVLHLLGKYRFDILGSGLSLVANPTFDENAVGGGTDIEMTVSYSLPILRYLSAGSLERFSLQGGPIFDLALNILGLGEEQLLDDVILLFEADSIPRYVDKINSHYSLSGGNAVQNPSGSTHAEKIANLAAALKSNPYLTAEGISPVQAVFEVSVQDANGDQTLANVNRLFERRLGSSPVDRIKDLFIPTVFASAYLSAGVEVSPNILKPISAATGEVISDGSVKTTFVFDAGEVQFSTTGGFGFGDSLTVTFPEEYPTAQIGNTGLTIGFTDAKLDLSRNSNLPEIDRDGRTRDFVGVFVEEASIGLPSSLWNVLGSEGARARLVGRNLIIGTGGLSGTIGLEGVTSGGTTYDVLEARFGGDDGFIVRLTRFDISFQQGAVVGSKIEGTLVIPGWENEAGGAVEVPVSVTLTDGGFEFSASASGLHEELAIPEILAYTIERLRLGKRESRYFVETSGTLDIIAEIPGIGTRFITQPIEINRLVIWSDGTIELDGGNVILPAAVALNMGPVAMSVTSLHLGAYQQQWDGVGRRYMYFGFDGGIKTGLGGIDARGRGVKFYFTVDGGELHTFLRVEAIHIDLTIPGDASEQTASLLLHGFVSVKNPEHPGDPEAPSSPENLAASPAYTEYAGGIDFMLPKIDMGGGASMRIVPATGAFLVDTHMNLSTPVAIGSTGLGIYGFQGTFGNRYVLSKSAAGVSDEATWWEFYKKDPRGIGITKFREEEGISVGAGASIATLGDQGQAFSSKLYFMLSIPEAYLLEGQAAIMSRRLGLDQDADPPFYAIITLAPGDSISANFGANVNIPDPGGEILALQASLEMAYFFGKSSAWYIYIGRDEPQSARIEATLLKLFNAHAYFMLAASGIKAGAGVDWEYKQDCGIAVVGLGASLEVGGRVSFKPVQLGGWVRLMGYAELKVFGIGFRLLAKAMLAAEAPQPFIISGGFQLGLDLPWPFGDIDVNVNLSWRFHELPDRRPIGSIDAGKYPSLEAYRSAATFPVKGVNMMSQEPFLLNYVNRDHPVDIRTEDSSLPAPGQTGADSWIGDFGDFIVPLDTYIDVEFAKGVLPVAGSESMRKFVPPMSGGVCSELVPPQRGRSNQIEHTYKVRNVSLFYWTGSAWEPYRMEQLNTPLLRILEDAQDPSPEATLATVLRYGAWQATLGGKHTTLRILGRTPFDRNATLSPTESDFPPAYLICPEEPRPMSCLDWSEVPLATLYPANEEIFDRKLALTVTSGNAEVVALPNIFGLPRSLMLKRNDRIELRFPQPVNSVALRLSTLAENVTISYYRGYAYVPGNDEQQGGTSSGDGADSWEIVTAEESSDEILSRLRAMPGFIRALCEGPQLPAETAGPVVAIAELMDGVYGTVHTYLRQVMGLEVPPEEEPATFCDRLREMLRVIIVGYTGGIPIPAVFRSSVERFYRDVQTSVEAFLRLPEGAGQPPDGGADLFYEQWGDLIACLGTLCDARGNLPGYIDESIAVMIDPAIGQLYNRLAGEHWYGSGLSARTDLRDTCDQLRAVAGFIALVSLDYQELSGGIIPGILSPYYQTLEEGAIAVRALMNQAWAGNCILPSCTGAAGLAEIARLFCTGTLHTGAAAVTGIETLLDEFEPARDALLESFGWDMPAGNSGDFCANLRAALEPLVVALSVLDELPFSLRRSVVEFHEKLGALVTQYRRETLELPAPAPDQEADAFAEKWNAIFACLCAICSRSPEALEPVAGNLDEELGTLFGNITALLHTGAVTGGRRMLLYGSRMPERLEDRVAGLTNFFTSFLTGCSITMPAGVKARLDTAFTAFDQLYTQVEQALSGYTLCQGPLGGYCGEWGGLFECLRGLRLRQSEYPAGIRNQIGGEELGDIVDSIYRIALGFTPTEPVLVPAGSDLLLLEIEGVLKFFYEYCLQGDDIPTNKEQALAPYLEQLRLLFSRIIALPDYEGVNVCHINGMRSPHRREQLVEFHRLLCMVPPIGIPWPPPEILALVADAGEMLADITSVLNIDPVPVQGAAYDFCGVFGNVVRTLVIAYGAEGALPLRVLAEMRRFCDAMQEAIDDAITSAPAIPSGSCAETASRWLADLSCLEKICSYRWYLPGQIYTAVETYLGGAIEELYREALLLADMLGLPMERNRSTSDRCRRAALIRNFIAIQSLDYAGLESPGTLPWFTNQDELESVYLDPALDGARYTACATDKPYDPLMKRETVARLDLLDEVIYDNADVAIDRIIIEPEYGCDSGDLLEWGPVLAELDVRLQSLSDTKETLEDVLAVSAVDGPEYRRTARELAGINAAIGLLDNYKSEIPLTGIEPCGTYLHAVCWHEPEDYQYNVNLPDPEVIAEEARTMAISLNTLTQPVWRPDTTYAVQIETVEWVRDVLSDGRRSGEEVYTRFHTFGFRTAGGVGHFHQTGNGSDDASYRKEYLDLLRADREAEYKYADLKHYINYANSYPNADGALSGAKPLYYHDVQLLLFYVHDYVNSMFSGWSPHPQTGLAAVRSGMRITIKDPASDGSNGDIVIEAPEWDRDPRPVIGRHIRKFKNIVANGMADGAGCITITPVEESGPPARMTAVNIVSLQPRKLYTAIFEAMFGAGGAPDVGREVHNYVFQTSRYRSFREHIETWMLDGVSGSERALYDIPVYLPATGAAVLGHLLNDSEPSDPVVLESVLRLRREYASGFDRIADGLLRLRDIPAPATTEVNVLRSGDDVIGLLVRSPEPLNDPKVPRTVPEGIAPEDFGKVLGDSLSVSGIASPVVLFSTDCTSVLLLGEPAGSGPWDLELKFRYLRFDGIGYRFATETVETGGVQEEITLEIPIAITIE